MAEDHHAEQAARQLSALVERQPDNRRARRLLAAAQWRSGDARATVATLRPIVERPDADSYSLALIGQALAQLHDPAAAGFLARAARPQPNALSALDPLNDTDFARLRQSAGQRPGDGPLQVRLVSALLALGLSGCDPEGEPVSDSEFRSWGHGGGYGRGYGGCGDDDDDDGAIEIDAQAGFSCDFGIAPGTPPELLGPAIERDRMYMADQPGMLYGKHLPLSIDPFSGALASGGRYLFETKAQAAAYSARSRRNTGPTLPSPTLFPSMRVMGTGPRTDELRKASPISATSLG